MKRAKRPPPPSAVVAPARGSSSWPLGLLAALLLVVTLIAYLPCLKGQFLWDDPGHITPSELLSWGGLGRIWTEPGATQQYYPLLHTAFWLEHRLWGDAPVGYHLINVLWHALSAALLVAILRRLAVPGALLAGLLFALHPVAVESVAWISEQKNTLSTVFALAAVLAWLRFEEDRRPARYIVALLWFVAALLTKTVTATLPGALLVIAWWRRGRLSWRNDCLPLAPWLALSVLAGVGTSWFEHTQIGAAGTDFTLGVAERVLLAGRVGWFYLGKLLWPVGLTFFYPRWNIDAGALWQWLFPAATVALLVVLFVLRKRSRAPLAVALLFGGTLFPVLGFMNVYPFVFSYVADHFQYLASLAVLAFLAAAATNGFARLAWPRWSGPVVATILLLVLGTLTWRQSATYRDIFVLYETTLERNPASWVAQLNLGTALDDAGDSDQALPHLQRALELKPAYPETLNSLGNVLNRLNRAAEALPYLQQATQRQPRFASAHNTLGVSLMMLGRTEEGMAAFRQALALDPTLVLARGNLGWALARSNRMSEAIVEFEQAARAEPASADLEYKWGVTLALLGRSAEAVTHFSSAVEQEPNSPESRYALGRALLQAGRREEAVAQLKEVLALNPAHAGAREVLGQLQQVPQ